MLTAFPAPAAPPPSRKKLLSEELKNDVVLEALANGENPVLARGYSGAHIGRVQARLRKLGIEVEGDPPGKFGDGTKAAVATFQGQNHLRETGQIDSVTILQLDAGSAKR